MIYVVKNLNKTFKRGVAQPGSAPAWGAGGRRFESSRPDHLLLTLSLYYRGHIIIDCKYLRGK